MSLVDEFVPVEDDGWNTDEQCPWCGKMIDELYLGLTENGSACDIECPHCEKPIVGEMWIQYILKKPKAQP